MIVSFDHLPDDARVWVFASSDPLDTDASARLLESVDAWLADWKAHGESLTCARTWRDDHFLAVGVDQRSTGASGCSIDALFRVLRAVEQEVGTSLLSGGRVFYREKSGEVRSTDRETFGERLRAGALSDDTPVFDTTVTSAGDFRGRFEKPVAESWHRELV
jgi:hypothetical protein